MARAALKPDPPESETHAATLARVEPIIKQFEKLLEEKRAREVARALAGDPNTADTERCEWARQTAGDFRGLAERRPAQFARELEELGYRIEEGQPAYRAAIEERDTARQRETSRIAQSLQPRQQKIARQLADALSTVSKLIADAEGLQRELESSAPLPTSAYLPNLVAGLGDMKLGDPQSAVSLWARRIKHNGIL
jgi:hypothetical protein